MNNNMKELLERMGELNHKRNLEKQKEMSVTDALKYIYKQHLILIDKMENHKMKDYEIIRAEMIKESIEELFNTLTLMEFIENDFLKNMKTKEKN